MTDAHITEPEAANKQARVDYLRQHGWYRLGATGAWPKISSFVP